MTNSENRFSHPYILSKLLSGTALTTGLGLALYAAVPAAYAACTGSGPVYSCDGPTAGPITIERDGDITVTTESGFYINTTDENGHGLALLGGGSVILNDEHASTIQSAGSGLGIRNINDGSLGNIWTQVNTGTIIGSTFALGIENHTLVGDSTIKVNVDTIQAGLQGISAFNTTSRGEALTEITAGTVTVDQGDGIYASALAEDGNTTLRIAADSIEAAGIGIYFNNTAFRGDAVAEIVAGTITASGNGDGIFGYSAAEDGNSTLRVTADSIEANYWGIGFSHHTNRGDVLTEIRAGSIVSGGTGIFGYGYVEDGNTTLKVAADSIEAVNGGIDVSNYASRGNALADITAGSITSEGYGISGSGTAEDGNITLRIAADSIEARFDGVNMGNAAYYGSVFTEVAVGTVAVDQGSGITALASSYEGNNTLKISADSIEVSQDGIRTISYSILGDVVAEISAGSITSDQGGGIYAFTNAGEGNNTSRINVGSVSAETVGIFAETTTNTGDSLTDITAGSIFSGAGRGVEVYNWTDYGRADFTLKVDTIDSHGDAIWVQQFSYENASSSSTINISTDGDIVSRDGTGIWVAANDADTHVTVSGLVHGGDGTAIDLIRADGADGADDVEQSTTLELRSGYALEGVTLATAQDIFGSTPPRLDLPNTHLVLDGSGTAVFDLSRIDNRYEAISDGDPNRITGFGTLTKTGNSIWTLTGTNDAHVADGVLYANVGSGILALDGASLVLAQAGSTPEATGLLTIGEEAGLSSVGASTVFGDVANTGSIILANSYAGGNGSHAGDVLTINGNYIGNGGTIVFDTVLGGDNSATDMLHVTGDTSGQTTAVVRNAAGTGDYTVNGIRLIQVDGASNGEFALHGDYVDGFGRPAVVGGAFAYTLEKGGNATPNDSDWYLRSQLVPTDPVDPIDPVEPGDPELPVVPAVYQPGVPLYEAYPQVLQALNGLPTLQQRVGNRYWDGFAARGTAGSAFWGRVEGVYSRMTPAISTSASSYDINTFRLQAGLDGQFYESEAGRLIGGLTLHHGSASANVRSFFGDGRISTEGYGFGGTLTWYGANGFYVDGQAQGTWYDSTLSSQLAGRTLVSGNDGFGHAFSLEAGQRMALAPHWTLTPQAQFVYSKVSFDSFTDTFDARVSLDRADSLRARLGLALEYEQSWQAQDGTKSSAHVYGIANLTSEFGDGTHVDVAGLGFANRNDRLWGGIGLGATYSWNDDKVSIYGEGAINANLADIADNYSVKGTVGLRVKW